MAGCAGLQPDSGCPVKNWGGNPYPEVNSKWMIGLIFLRKRSPAERSAPESLLCGFSGFVHAICGGLHPETPQAGTDGASARLQKPAGNRIHVNHLCQIGIADSGGRGCDLQCGL